MTLESFNASYASSYNNLAKDYDRYGKTLRQMKDDLDSIFRRIRYVLAPYRSLRSHTPRRVVRTRLGLPEPPPAVEGES